MTPTESFEVHGRFTRGAAPPRPSGAGGRRSARTRSARAALAAVALWVAAPAAPQEGPGAPAAPAVPAAPAAPAAPETAPAPVAAAPEAVRPAGSAAARGVDLPALAAAPTGKSHPGKLVWFDLLTLDPAAAERFYGGLLGWTFERRGDYLVAKEGGTAFAGILRMPPQAGQTPQARWVPLVSVKDLDVAAAAVRRQGGKVLEGPGSLGARGRYVAVADPRGAQLVLLSSATGDPPDADAGGPGWIWAELWSDDPQRAATFYKEVVGYEIWEEGSGKAAAWILATEGRPRTRVARMPFVKVTAQWLPYAAVADVKAAIARVKELGGRVLHPPSSSVAQGSLALVSDPGGAVIVLEKKPDAPALPPLAAPAAPTEDRYGLEAAQRASEAEAAAEAAAPPPGEPGADVTVVAPMPYGPYFGMWIAPSPWWGWWGPGWWGPGWVGRPPGWVGPPGWWRPYPPPGYRPPGTWPPGYRPPGYPPGYRPPGVAPAPPRPGTAPPGARPPPPRTGVAAPRAAPAAPAAPRAPAPAPAPRAPAPAPAPRR